MSENTKIEWCDHTFNPWVGCTKISPACDHCYAEGWAKRSGQVVWGGERKRTSIANWKLPLKWNHAAEANGIRPTARPMHPDWAYSLRDQCNEAGVPFLFKQWGDWHPAMGDTSQDRLAICKHTGGSFHISAGEYPRMFDMLDRCQMHRVGKKAAGRMLAGREWNGVPA